MKTFQPNYFKSAICAFAGLFLSISSIVGFRWMLSVQAFNFFRENDWIEDKTVIITLFILLYIGLFLLWLSLPVTVVLTENSIRKKGLFRSRQLQFDHIRGFFRLKFHFSLVGKSFPTRNFSIPLLIENREELIQHLSAQFPKINPKDKFQIREPFLNDESWGTSRENREATLIRLERDMVITATIGLIFYAWLLFSFDYPNVLLVAGFLFAPLALVYFKSTSGDLIIRFPSRFNVLSTVGIFIAPSVLLISAHYRAFHYVSYREIFFVSCGLAVLLFILFVWLFSSENSWPRPLIKAHLPFLLFYFFYSFSVASRIVSITESKPPKTLDALVLYKMEENFLFYESRRSQIISLDSMKMRTTMYVDKAIFENTEQKDTVKVNLHKGALGIRWLELAE